MNIKLKALLAVLSLSVMVNAASIDYLANNSASYFQNPSQTGQISVEGVFYNPAGTVFLEDGQYINANIQNSLVQESMTVNGKKLASNKYAGAPSFNYLYKKGNASYFANASVIAGGATLNYDEGVAGIELAAEGFDQLVQGMTRARVGIALSLNPEVIENKFNGQNRYYQLMVGGAYKTTDKLSVSGGLKYVHALRKLDGHAGFRANNTITKGAVGLRGEESLFIASKREADGVGAIIGLDYKATDTLNFALKYETPVKLNFKTTAKEPEDGLMLGIVPFNLSEFYPKYKDGVKSRRDLPGVLSLGVSKDIDKWTLSTGYIHYFNRAANMDGVKYKDGHEYNVGVDYRINEKFTWHAGFNYAKTGATKDTFNDTEYAINSQMYTTGLSYKPNEKHQWRFGYGFVAYNGSHGVLERREVAPNVPLALDKSKVKYDKKINVFTLGYTYKF